jgi:DNA-binding transcriptional LysR family regulator
MDVKTLYTLIAIADRGSFAEAGNAIGLSLSAVSMQMRALEEELGTTIFDRSRRPPVLTDSGVALIHRARDLIAHWESMSAALKREAGGGLLKLGSVHTCVSGVLPLALKRMRQQGHGVDIHLTTGLTHELEKAVHHRQLDVAIITEPDTMRSDLEFLPFAEESFVVITHRTTEGTTDKKVLESTPYVRFNRAARVGYLIHEEITRRKITVRSVMEIDNLEGVIAMVANGLGTSIVPARDVKNEFPAAIRTIPFGSPPLTRQLGVLVPRENPRAHLAQILLEALRAVSARGNGGRAAGAPGGATAMRA